MKTALIVIVTSLIVIFAVAALNYASYKDASTKPKDTSKKS